MFAVRQRSGRSTEALSYLPGLLIGVMAIWAIPRLFPQGLPIRGYGVMVLLGSITGLWMAVYRARQMNLEAEQIYSLAFGMFICGILGARLFYVIEYWESRFQFDRWTDTLLAVVKFTEGGLVVYGAFIGATLAFFLFAIKHKLPPLALADLIAPSLVAGLAFGRIGCLLNGCCYGGETSLPWAVTFPRESLTYMEQASSGQILGFQLAPTASDDQSPLIAMVTKDSPAARAGLQENVKLVAVNDQKVQSLNEAERAMIVALQAGLPLQITIATGKSFEIPVSELPPRSRPVHPTQVYSAIHAALLAWLLWSFYPFRRRDGEVTALMLTIYPVSRFLLEMIRVDESAVFGTGLSISQNISILLLIIAVGLWIYLLRRPAGTAALGSNPLNLT